MFVIKRMIKSDGTGERIMDINIQKYMAFVKTVEYGSFTKAAEVLNYSQSGISRMINDLEKEWNVSLLERGRAGVRLTSDGLILLPFTQSICNEYQKLLMRCVITPLCYWKKERGLKYQSYLDNGM